MKREEAQRILREEGLRYYNWFLDHDPKPWEVVIYQEAGRWVVCAADERACIEENSYRYFNNEEDALDCFIRLTRLEKKMY